MVEMPEEEQDDTFQAGTSPCIIDPYTRFAVGLVAAQFTVDVVTDGKPLKMEVESEAAVSLQRNLFAPCGLRIRQLL